VAKGAEWENEFVIIFMSYLVVRVIWHSLIKDKRRGIKARCQDVFYGTQYQLVENVLRIRYPVIRVSAKANLSISLGFSHFACGLSP
jgi:hypothetical protein